VIQRCLPLCFPLPESEDQNEASQVVGVEDPNEDGIPFQGKTQELLKLQRKAEQEIVEQRVGARNYGTESCEELKICCRNR
jgi:hypothetical protein